MISIVIPYLDRRDQLLNTLRSIEYFRMNHKIEVVIVDDGATLKDIPDFDLNIKIIKLKRDNHDPVIPLNVSFGNVSGEMILINCAECLHAGDIIKFVLENLNTGVYINFPAYSVDYPRTELLNQIDWQKSSVIEDVLKIITPTQALDLENKVENPVGWYAHPVFRNVLLPFCAALMKDDLEKLSGFDEQYAEGIGFADDDFVHRVNNLGLKPIFPEEPICIHQAHSPTIYEETKTTRNHELIDQMDINSPLRIRAMKNRIYDTGGNNI